MSEAGDPRSDQSGADLNAPVLPFEGTLPVGRVLVGVPRLVPVALDGIAAMSPRTRLATLLRRLLAGEPLGGLVMTRRELHEASGEVDAATLGVLDAVALVVAHLEAMGLYCDITAHNLGRDMARMAMHLNHHGARTIDEIDPADVEEWIRSATYRSGGWPAPSLGTMWTRRSAARLYFRGLRALHITRIDPSVDIRLPPRSPLSTRPLTEDEVLLGRLAAAHTLVEYRRPAAWALGEATLTTWEQAQVRRRDYRRNPARVWVAGNGRRTERWGYLTPWGESAIERALVQLPDDPDVGLVYHVQRDQSSGAVTVCRAVSKVLRDANLSDDEGVRPGSLVGWAGRKIFDETGRIEVVAARLGLSSLDSAARAIGWDWVQ